MTSAYSFAGSGTKTLSITSGKGGVGKTTMTCGLAQQLASEGQRVLVLDGDFGLSNAEILFGVQPRGHLLEVMQGDKSVQEILTPVMPGLDLLSGGRALTEFNHLSAFERKALVDSVSVLDRRYDYLLIDTAPGLSENVLYLNAAAQKSLVVITPDASSLADGYALIKVLHQQFAEKHFAIVCNMVRDAQEGFVLFQRFAEVTQRFLSLGLDYWGAVPTSPLIRKASVQSRMGVKLEGSDHLRLTFGQLTKRLKENHHNFESRPAKSGLQFFWEQVVGLA